MADTKVSRTPEELRAGIEAKRGIVRVEGKIVRSKAWLKDRVAMLETKLVDMKLREKNIKAEIKERTEQLKSAK